jgi:hypothetical protein
MNVAAKVISEHTEFTQIEDPPQESCLHIRDFIEDL